MSEKIHTIKLRVDDERDLYNSFAINQDTLSDDLMSYIEQKAEDRNIGEKVIIEVDSHKDIDIENLKRVFHKYIDDELNSLEKAKKVYSMKQIRLFIIGFIFIAIWLAFSKTNFAVIVEILSIIGSFAIWEATNIWLIDKPDLKMRRIKFEFLKNFEIVQTIRL